MSEMDWLAAHRAWEQRALKAEAEAARLVCLVEQLKAKTDRAWLNWIDGIIADKRKEIAASISSTVGEPK